VTGESEAATRAAGIGLLAFYQLRTGAIGTNGDRVPQAKQVEEGKRGLKAPPVLSVPLGKRPPLVHPACKVPRDRRDGPRERRPNDPRRYWDRCRKRSGR
jgi:hypothetical protein